MDIIQISIIACIIPSFFLIFPILYYYNRLIQLVKIKRRKLILSCSSAIFVGYLFLIASLFLKGEKSIFLEMAYLAFLFGLGLIGYVMARIYLDLKEAIK